MSTMEDLIPVLQLSKEYYEEVATTWMLAQSEGEWVYVAAVDEVGDVFIQVHANDGHISLFIDEKAELSPRRIREVADILADSDLLELAEDEPENPFPEFPNRLPVYNYTRYYNFDTGEFVDVN